MADIEEIARAYWKAEETRDVDKILSHFAPDAEWIGPGGMELQGHAEIRRFYEDTGRDFPGLKVEVTAVVGRGNIAALEWSAVLTDPKGTDHLADGVNVMKGDGARITSLHAYFDRSQVALGVH